MRRLNTVALLFAGAAFLWAGWRIPSAIASIIPALYSNPNPQPRGPVWSLPPVCRDAPCTSPDAGLSWACVVAPLSSGYLSSGATAQANYRTTLLLDGGNVPSLADNVDWPSTLLPLTLQPAATLTPNDAGATFAEVMITLSAADPSAGFCLTP